MNPQQARQWQQGLAQYRQTRDPAQLRQLQRIASGLGIRLPEDLPAGSAPAPAGGVMSAAPGSAQMQMPQTANLPPSGSNPPFGVPMPQGVAKPQVPGAFQRPLGDRSPPRVPPQGVLPMSGQEAQMRRREMEMHTRGAGVGATPPPIPGRDLPPASGIPTFGIGNAEEARAYSGRFGPKSPDDFRGLSAPQAAGIPTVADVDAGYVTEGIPAPDTIDAFGVPKDVDSPEIEARKINDIRNQDSSRTVVEATTEDLSTGEAQGGLFGGMDDDQKEALGAALMGFGSGVLTGGPNLGEAAGIGFAKGADQFVATKRDQRDEAMDALKIAGMEQQLEINREKMDLAREAAARARTGGGSWRGRLDDIMTAIGAGQDPEALGIDVSGIDLEAARTAATGSGVNPWDRASFLEFGPNVDYLDLTPEQERKLAQKYPDLKYIKPPSADGLLAGN